LKLAVLLLGRDRVQNARDLSGDWKIRETKKGAGGDNFA